MDVMSYDGYMNSVEIGCIFIPKNVYCSRHMVVCYFVR